MRRLDALLLRRRASLLDRGEPLRRSRAPKRSCCGAVRICLRAANPLRRSRASKRSHCEFLDRGGARHANFLDVGAREWSLKVVSWFARALRSSGLKLAPRAVCAPAESLRSGKVDARSVSQSSTCKIGKLKRNSFLQLKYIMRKLCRRSSSCAVASFGYKSSAQGAAPQLRLITQVPSTQPAREERGSSRLKVASFEHKIKSHTQNAAPPPSPS